MTQRPSYKVLNTTPLLSIDPDFYQHRPRMLDSAIKRLSKPWDERLSATFDRMTLEDVGEAVTYTTFDLFTFGRDDVALFKVIWLESPDRLLRSVDLYGSVALRFDAYFDAYERAPTEYTPVTELSSIGPIERRSERFLAWNERNELIVTVPKHQLSQTDRANYQVVKSSVFLRKPAFALKRSVLETMPSSVFLHIMACITINLEMARTYRRQRRVKSHQP